MTKQNRGVFAFIDAENMRNAVEARGYDDLDYKKLALLLQSRGVTRTFIYAAILENDQERLNRLTSLGKTKFYEVKIKEVITYKKKPFNRRIICPNCGKPFLKKFSRHDVRKGNCDAELTLDIIQYGVRKKYKGIIVFSGDGDFTPVYEYVSLELKKPVQVYGRLNTARSVKNLAVNKIISLETIEGLLPHYGLKNKKTPRRRSF